MVVGRLFLFIADIFSLQTLSTSLIMSIFVAKSFTKTLTNFLINGIIYMSIIFLEDINEREI